MPVSPQQSVTPGPNAASPDARLAWAWWIWLAAAVSAALLAGFTGGNLGDVAGALALAASPALAGFLLLPRAGNRRADLAMIAVWVLAATGLAAGTGGAGSPVAALFAVPPAVALALGRPWAPEAGGAAVLGYATSAALALLEPPRQTGAFAEILAIAALAFAAGLMALGAGARRSSEHAAGQRIAEVSHELRTPLTHILGFSEMIERQMFGEIGARYVEYAGLIRRSGAHLLSLVNDLLDLSKIDAGRYELEFAVFDIRSVIDDVVRMSTDAAAKKTIALGMVTPEAPLMVRADDRALKRILINTLGNAIKFTPEGGRVMVTAAAVNGQLELDTSDTGPGISPEDREKLGRAYERGSGGGRAEGTGLGLALVRALSALHGGTLSFHEAPGGGALVRVRLPVLASEGG